MCAVRIFARTILHMAADIIQLLQLLGYEDNYSGIDIRLTTGTVDLSYFPRSIAQVSIKVTLQALVW
jgi:hypothetical protein